MGWGGDKRDKLRVSWERRGLGLDPSHEHRIWRLEGPFCLESRGQLSSVCLFLLSLPTGGHEGHSQENREGGLARTVSLNLQRASERWRPATLHLP